MRLDHPSPGFAVLPTKCAIAALLLATYATLIAFWALVPEREMLEFLTAEQLLGLLAVSGPASYVRLALRASSDGPVWTLYFVGGSGSCLAALFGSLFLRSVMLRFRSAGIAVWIWFCFGFVQAICLAT